MAEINRLQTNDLELGITEAVQKHISRTVVSPKPVSQRKLDFEHARSVVEIFCLHSPLGLLKHMPFGDA